MNLFGLKENNLIAFRVITIFISLVPLLFAIFYPKIGSILGYAGAVSGFLMIYLVPVVAYLQMKRLEILDPLRFINKEGKDMSKWYIECGLHLVIPIYGFTILVLVFTS